MNNSVEITSQDQFKDWLEQQPAEICQAIACRASLRSLPELMRLTDHNPIFRADTTMILASLRATLLSGVSSMRPPPDRSELGSAFSAATSAARSAHSEAFSSTSSVADSGADHAAAATYSSAFSATRSAAHSVSHSAAAPALAAGSALSAAYADTSLQIPNMFHAQLWPDPTEIGHLLRYLEEFRIHASKHAEWAFWAEWYQGFVDGKPLDWELQRRVAVIDDAIWDQGPEAVAAAIDDIKADMFAEKLPQADKVSFDPDKAVFEATPEPLNANSLLETTLNQVAFAQKIAAQSNCGFNSNCVAWQYIDYTLEDCREDANAIEQNLEIARSDIVEGLSNGTYFEDAKLSALEQVLDRAVTDLRANHPDVAEAWEVRIKHTLRVAKADQKQIIVEKATALIEVTHEKMGRELALDAKTIAATDGEVQGHAIRRFFGRIVQMRILLRSKDIIRCIDENYVFKGTSILLDLQSLINLVTGLF